MMHRWVIPALAATLLFTSSAYGDDIPADPSDYKQKLAAMLPGDVLKLAAGDYGPMQIVNINGQPGSPITIEGPVGGAPARFLGNGCCNTIDITDSSYITLRNLYLDGQNIPGIDAIKAGGASPTNYSHHITIEGCAITGHDGGQTDQQAVGISTKIVSWDWIVRYNLIDGAGTGMYFGNSDGTRAFIGGLIEGNLFRSTLGYNMQIKHQLAREQVPGVPSEKRVTIIRNNVFIKRDLPSPDGVRPNLLVDGFPDSGPGSNDHYEIYGNFLYHNSNEVLLQASGRVHIHDNILVDSLVGGIVLVNHQGKTVIDGLVYNNTVYDTVIGINFASTPSGISLVGGNAVFAGTPLNGTMTNAFDNITDTVPNAANYVSSPSNTLGVMDFYPIVGSPLAGPAMDLSSVSTDVDYTIDFNGNVKDFTYRGAYQGEGVNPGWVLGDSFKDGGGMGTGGAGGGSSAGPSSGGIVNPTGGPGGVGPYKGDQDKGCACTTAGADAAPQRALWLLLVAFGLRLRRKPRAI